MGAVQSSTTASSGKSRSALAQTLDPHGLFLEPSGAFRNADPGVSSDQLPAHCHRRSSSASSSPAASLDGISLAAFDAVLDFGQDGLEAELEVEDAEEKGGLRGQELIDCGMERIVPGFLVAAVNERKREKRTEDAFRRRSSGSVGTRLSV